MEDVIEASEFLGSTVQEAVSDNRNMISIIVQGLTYELVINYL